MLLWSSDQITGHAVKAIEFSTTKGIQDLKVNMQGHDYGFWDEEEILMSIYLRKGQNITITWCIN